MKKTKKHIILLGILLFLYSGQILAHGVLNSLIEKQSVQNHVLYPLLKSATILSTVEYPIKEDLKKGTITVDNEEEEIEGMISKKNIEKSKLIFSVFTELSTHSIQKNIKSLYLYNDFHSNHSYHLLYLLFEVFRI